MDNCLRVPDAKGIYAAGDCIHLKIGGRWASKMAEEAMFQRETIAENIWRDLKGLDPKPHKIRFSTDNPKCLVSLGGGVAVIVVRAEDLICGETPVLA